MKLRDIVPGNWVCLADKSLHRVLGNTAGVFDTCRVYQMPGRNPKEYRYKFEGMRQNMTNRIDSSFDIVAVFAESPIKNPNCKVLWARGKGK